jgi:hypothetical protein
LPFSPYLAAHRVDPIDPAMAKAQRAILAKITQLERGAIGRGITNDEAATMRGYVDSMRVTCATARNEHLAHPLGIALTCEIIRRPEYDAGIEYSLLHRQIYGRLRDDVEAAFTAELGPEALALARGVGRTSRPQPPTSMFRELVGGAEQPPFTRPSPEEYEKNRRAIGRRYAKAYAILRADFWIHSVIDGALILGHEAKYLYVGDPRTADDQLRRKALQSGLRLLAEHFGYDRAERQGRAPAAPGMNGTENGVDPPRQRRRGLPVMFSSATDDRPADADVSAAVSRLRKSPI